MKAISKTGRKFTRDHPHEIISPHVMRFEEIRSWIRELANNKEYGWNVAGLERALGIQKNMLRKKLTTSWIWPKEQVRLTARIREILDGVIVPRKFGRNRIDGVVVDPPEPPKLSKPRSITINYAGANISFQAPPKRLVLPAFKDAFTDVQVWNPDGDPM